MGYKFSFEVIWNHIDALLHGLSITLQITGISMMLGLLLGVFLAIFRLSRNFALNKAAAVYIEFFRCTPPLVQLVWIFFCLPILLGVDVGNYTSSIIALTLYVAAIYAEAFRSGIQSIEQDQIDGAIALGLSSSQRIRYVVLPQAVRIVIPVLLSCTVSLFKESSLVSTVGMNDLMYAGRIVSTSTYRPIEILTAVAIIYFIIAFPVTLLTRKLEVIIAKKLER
jgi:polar amino acid transport system permease protein